MLVASREPVLSAQTSFAARPAEVSSEGRLCLGYIVIGYAKDVTADKLAQEFRCFVCESRDTQTEVQA